LGVPVFTINLTRASKAAWERRRKEQRWYPPKPSANGAEGMRPAESIRIGNLIPVSDTLHDRWWLVDDEATHSILGDQNVGPLIRQFYGPPMAPDESRRRSLRRFETTRFHG
jgi:hypothetical protein